MMDVVKKNHDVIDVARLGQELGCPVVEISALKGIGIQEAAKKVVFLAQEGLPTAPVHKFAEEVENVLTQIEEKITGVKEEEKRFFAIDRLYHPCV